MPSDVSKDHLFQIRIEGMHCHKCELTLQKALGSIDGVHEVEVDSNSKLASVLLDNSRNVDDLVQAVTDAGYVVIGVSQFDSPDQVHQSA